MVCDYLHHSFVILMIYFEDIAFIDVWLSNVIISLLIGFVLKKNIKEIGPTGPLKTLEKQVETLRKQNLRQG